uniref:WW domain-containing protein n=1 Tax=Peronospora matthiolae TaxID=2874970 RepID=A0AAV1UPL0_9STRA
MASTHSRSNNQTPSPGDDASFGWQLFHDRQRNLIYYLHTYTGEVRWPRPETVGFVMHGLKPLPAAATMDTEAGDKMDKTDTSSLVNPDIWSPYYPHVVMLPSGLVQVHPSPAGSDATEMWCGYNRFPLTANAKATRAFPELLHSSKGYCASAMMTCKPRLLPPTWEDSSTGPPFLPPYPVTILEREANMEEDKRPAAAGCDQFETFHTPEIEIPCSTPSLQTSECEGREESSMDSLTSSKTKTSIAPAKQLAFPKELPAPNPEKKEHNRKGYLLRQARKMIRGSGGTAAAVASASAIRPRKNQEMVSAITTRPEVAVRTMEEVQDNGSTVTESNMQPTRLHR